MKQIIISAFILMFTQVNTLSAGDAVDIKNSKTIDADTVFAKVGDMVITRNEFEAVYQRAKRQKFYHGKPSDKEQDSFLRKTTDDLIDRKLLLQEAVKRGIKIDEEEINKTLDNYQKRYGQSDRWQREGAKMLVMVGERLREDQLLRQLEKEVMKSNHPDDSEIKIFYQNNQDKFTEPETQRVSLILLKVDPSSSDQVWEDAETAASKIKTRLKNGEKFSDLAAEYSADITAKSGGDMGYLHKGMLGQAAETAVDNLSVGGITDAVRVLEGVAIFRLEDRKESRLRPFNEVQSRAAALWQREKSETLWKELKQQLRNSTEIKIYFEQKDQA